MSGSYRSDLFSWRRGKQAGDFAVISPVKAPIWRTGARRFVSRDQHAAIDVLNERLQAEGYRVFAGGLRSPSLATVIDNRHREALFTGGPFLESKECLAGFWVIEAANSTWRLS
jgi:hypothetical protein